MGQVVTWQDFSHYLRAIRNSRQLSQRGLADLIGCTSLHVYKLEHGRSHPSKPLLLVLRQSFFSSLKMRSSSLPFRR